MIDTTGKRLQGFNLWFKGGSSDTVDKEYNRRMATIAEAQQGMSEDYFDYETSVLQPYEQAQINANTSLMAGETALSAATTQAGLSTLPSTTQAQIAQAQSVSALSPVETQYKIQAMQDAAPVRSAFYKSALTGVNAKEKANQAAADATQAFMNQTSAGDRAMANRGINPGSGSYNALSNQSALGQAGNIATARTSARTAAENENFDRLQSAMSTTGAL